MSKTEIEFVPDFDFEGDEGITAEQMDNIVDKVMQCPSWDAWESGKKGMRSVIIDIDGTLSNCVPRLEFDSSNKLNWEKFFKGMENDLPNEWCVRLAQIYYKMGFIVYIVTGRPSEYMDVTKKWLDKWSVPYDFLYMREEGDYRKDDVVKRDILHALLPKKELIEFVVDDRQVVVDMWRDEGLTCLQCKPHAE